MRILEAGNCPVAKLKYKKTARNFVKHIVSRNELHQYFFQQGTGTIEATLKQVCYRENVSFTVVTLLSVNNNLIKKYQILK